MKAIEMKMLQPYRATTSSSDRTVLTGQIMWVSRNGDLCLPDRYGGGVLLREEWSAPNTCDFEVEEASGYIVEIRSGSESLRYCRSK